MKTSVLLSTIFCLTPNMFQGRIAAGQPVSRQPSQEIRLPGQSRHVTGDGSCIRKLQSSVFLIGNGNGTFGTAFLISRKHRLLATNAHVADMVASDCRLIAIPNNAAKTFEIDKVWYHPAVQGNGGNDSIDAQSPSSGVTTPHCPDVAVVRLAGTSRLPAACKFASMNEILSATGRPVFLAGFPGSDTSWPEPGGKPRASYVNGIVSRMTGFGLKNLRRKRSQLLQHTATSHSGSSGSPLFLANGHVIGISNSFRLAEDRGSWLTISHGIRIDCLYELIEFHGLDKLVSIPADHQTFSRKRFGKLRSKPIELGKYR